MSTNQITGKWYYTFWESQLSIIIIFPWNKINNMDQNQPITTYRCDLLNLLKKARVSREVRLGWVILLTCGRTLLKLVQGGSNGGAVVRALAFHQCGPGSNPDVDAICGLSLLLVLSLALRGFSLGTLVFPSPQKPTLPNSNSIWNTRTRLNEFIWTLKCFVGKKAIYIFFYNAAIAAKKLLVR